LKSVSLFKSKGLALLRQRPLRSRSGNPFKLKLWNSFQFKRLYNKITHPNAKRLASALRMVSAKPKR
ncbi:MAG: hypothetical protein LBC86_01400, partial [Oscillospiraceae bacterium]|nr:hypothetical protein [Oscillospiraceae bacterium]